MITANKYCNLPVHILYSSTSFGDTMHGWEQLIHATHSTMVCG